jgi:hypothetical protein
MDANHNAAHDCHKLFTHGQHVQDVSQVRRGALAIDRGANPLGVPDLPRLHPLFGEVAR